MKARIAEWNICTTTYPRRRTNGRARDSLGVVMVNWKQWEGQIVEGKFPLLQYLGGSDHSGVFLTELRDQELRKAALKLKSSEADNGESQLSRWKLAATLSHPHLIRLSEMGRCRLADMDAVYVVMEYAEEDLSQVLPQRSLTPVETQEMLAGVLDALAEVHNNGLIHGRLRPSNIMAVSEQLKLSTDGLCTIGDSPGDPVKWGVYDPPERANAGASPAGDVWSLGITLVETLTQHPPAWDEIAMAEPQVPETLPAPFLVIARHCLHRDPGQRWTIGQIKALLLPALSSPVPVERVTVEVSKPSAKAMGYLVPVALGVVLLAMLVGTSLLRPRTEPAKASSAEIAHPEAKKPAAAQPDVKPPEAKPAEPPEVKPEHSARMRGAVINQVVPAVPQKARDTIQGAVRVSVKVAVDSTGSVTSAALDAHGPSNYFADLALRSARRWTFTPARIDDRAVASEWLLRFQFERTATRVLPIQTAP